MSTRFRTPAMRATAIAILATLVVAGLALGKEGAVARLDTAVRRDAEPGSTIKVGWSVLMAVDGQMRPIFGSPTYVRLVSPDGTSTTEAFGQETAFESGHYVASIVLWLWGERHPECRAWWRDSRRRSPDMDRCPSGR